MTNEEAVNLINSIKCPPYHVNARYSIISDIVEVYVDLYAKDALGLTKGISPIMMRAEYIAEFHTPVSLLSCILGQLEKLVCHEIREWFDVNGEKPFYPHPRITA